MWALGVSNTPHELRSLTTKPTVYCHVLLKWLKSHPFSDNSFNSSHGFLNLHGKAKKIQLLAGRAERH